MHARLSWLRPSPVAYRGSRPRWLRRLALLNTALFCYVFILAQPLKALADTLSKLNSASSALKPRTFHLPVKLSPPASAHCLKPLPEGAARRQEDRVRAGHLPDPAG